jgi:hypothetical protein
MASGATPIYLLPYPFSTDPVDVHGDIQELSDRLEIVLGVKVDKNVANTLTKTNTYTLTGSDNGIIINQAGTGVPLRITNTGTGNSFLVEDAASTDSTPFVIDASGNVGIGKTTPTVLLDVAGVGAFSGALTASTFNALTLTAAATGFTIAGGTTSKTLTVNNTLALSGTDSTTMTFPATSQTIAGLAVSSQVFTTAQTFRAANAVRSEAASTQDAMILAGRAGGTGSFALTLTPTTLAANRTVTFQDVAGTVYVSGGTDVALADGGTNASLTASNGGIVYSTASAMAILAGTATAGQMLQSGASTTPAWSTATFPSTATGTGTILRANGTNWVATTATYPTTTTVNQILYSSAANTIAEITTGNSQVLVTNGSGVPAFSGTLPSGVTASSLTSFGSSPTITTPTIDTINTSFTTSGTAALWNTGITTGTISVGNALTTGTLNVATGGTGATNINIGHTNSIIGLIGNTSITGTLSTTGNVTIGGDLTVNGTLTSVNSNTVNVDDKNLELGSVIAGTISTTGTIGTVAGAGPFTATITGMSSTSGIVPGSVITATAGTGNFGSGVMSVASVVSNSSITVSSTLTFTAGNVTNILGGAATDATANGGGITLKGATDKTILWDSTNNNWTSSENWNIPTGKTFKINNVSVLSSTAVLGLTPTINATGYTLSGGTTAVAVTFAGGAAYTISGTNGQTYTLSSTGGTIATNPMTTLGDLAYGGASGVPTRLAGNASNGVYFLRENVTASASVAPDWIGSTGSGSVVLATSPAIAGGTHTGLTGLAIRDTSAAFDVTLAATSSTALTAGRSLTFDLINAARTVKLGGNIDLANNLTTTGAFALTLTTTAATIATLPSGTITLVDLAATQALTNKTISGLTVTTTTGTLTMPAATVTHAGAFATTITATAITNATLPAGTTTLAANVTTTIGDTIYASATAAPGTLARLAGNTSATRAFLGQTGDGTNSAAPSWTTSTGSGSVVLGTSPTIAGGTHTALTSFGIRDTSAAFDVTIAAVSSTALTAGRTLTLDLVNAARTIKLAGNLDIAGNVTHAGAFTQTFTATGNTSLTLPTSGTLATNVTTTIGDLIYASATGTPGTLARLAGNTTASRRFLRQTGDGTNSAAPAWDALVDADIPSALTSKSYNGLTLTSTTGTFTLAAGKTFTVNNTLTLSGTDASTLNIGTGGTLGTAAYTASTAYISSTLMTTLGDIIHGGASGAATRLAGSAVTGQYFLTENVIASAAVAPTWQASTGTAGSNVVLATSPTITTPKIDSITTTTGAAATPTIYSDVTTGTIAIGAGITTGTVNIATAGTGANSINIGNTNSTLTVNGNLTVNGTTTTVNSVTITVDDPNLELNSIASPTDANASGGGITLKSAAGDKSIVWDVTNTNWTANQHFNIPTAKVYKINNTQVLSSTAVLGITPTVNATGFSLSGGTTAVAVTFAGGAAYTVSGTNGTTTTLPSTTGTLALNNQTFFIGTQSIAINAGTGTITSLPGVSTINGATVPTSGTLATNVTTTIGDVIYASATGTPGTLARLAGNTTTTRKFFRQTGDGTNSAAPAWDTLVDADLPAALTGKSYNGLTLTSTTGTFTLTAAKTFAVQNTITLAGTDSSTLNIGAGGTLGTGAFATIANYAPLAGATFTGQIQSTLANSTTTGGGQIYLNGATGNRIDFNQNGVAAPAFTTRSAGTKIALWPGVAAAAADYAIGIDSSTLWNSVDTTAASFKWYGGITLAATLTGTGNLTTVGSVTASSIIKSGGLSSQYLMADGSTSTAVSAAAGTLTGSTLAAGVTASSLTSLGTLTSLSVSGTSTFSSTVTVPTPTNSTDAANKAYVDSVLNAGVPEIVPLDDISGEFNGVDSVFVPKYQGIKQSITNPLRLQLAINGIIQYVDFPDYVWQSPLPREGFQINNDGNIAFSEVVPAGSRFDAMIQPGPNTITKKRQYPFKAVDILLGG